MEETFAYTSYKVDFCPYDGFYKAYGHSTKRHTLGAIRKEKGVFLPVSYFSCGELLILRMVLPFGKLDITGIPENHSLCVSPEIYRNHYGEIYHKLDSHRSGAVMSLIEIN